MNALRFGLKEIVIGKLCGVFAHPHTQAREMILETEHASAGTVKLPGFPYKFSGTPAEIQKPPPMLGQHTEEVLTSLLDYSKEGVASLGEKGAI
jgi:crotonobetainyl-CoA:carnitine CoA-transferase CaiB-like acyl-CoA transferase